MCFAFLEIGTSTKFFIYADFSKFIQISMAEVLE